MQISGSKREIPKQEGSSLEESSPLPWGPEPVLGGADPLHGSPRLCALPNSKRTVYWSDRGSHRRERAGRASLDQNQETGYGLVVRSNEVGVFAAQELTIGHYKLTVEAAGFKTVTASNVELNAGTVVRVDFKLQIGERQETVEVTDAAVPINSENSRLAQTVDSTQNRKSSAERTQRL